MKFDFRRTLCLTGSAFLLAGALSGFSFRGNDVLALHTQAASYGVTTGTGYTVDADVLNVRSGPGMGYARVGQLTRGYAVTVEKTENGFGKIRDGWVSLDYLRPQKNSYKPNAGFSGTAGTVNASILNIRRGPGFGYDVVGQYTNGYKVTIQETEDGWGHTADGWVKLTYVTSNNSTVNSNPPAQKPAPAQKPTPVQKADNTAAITVNSDVVVTSNTLNVRSGPGIGNAKVTELSNGSRVTILQLQDGWGRTQEGWINLSYVRPVGTSSSKGTMIAGSSVVVAADQLTVRRGPGINYQECGSLQNGYRVTLEEVRGAWGRFSDGWISLQYVNLLK